MLSLDDCRRRLNDPTLSDEQLAEIRDTLNAFARLLVEDYIRTHRRPRQ